MGVVVSDRGDAVEMVVTGPWSAEAAAAVREGGVDRLVLNYALGFDEPSLEFLEGLPLRELVILDRRLSDLDPVYSLGSTLRALSVTTDPASKIDLGRLPGLRSVSAEWSQVADSVESASDIRVAFLDGYQPVDLTPLEAMGNLTELVMKDRPKLKSLAGVSIFPELRLVGIYLAKNLVDIEELAGRPEIEDLALEACRKVSQIDFLAGCSGLRRLNLSECDEIASLQPIRALTNLEKVSLFGSTKIADDDLSPLAGLPQLQQLRMRSRRSYRPSVEEIQALLPRS
ncbi:MAG: hypothetical protein ACRCYU_11890 [Nocardioides sp.]